MGAGRGAQRLFTAKAGADLSSESFVFVKYSSTSTDANPVVETTAAEDACGILQIGAALGKQVEVAMLGGGNWSKLRASTTIAVGAKIGPTTGGEGVTVTANKARYYAVAEEAATATDDVIVVETRDAYISACNNLKMEVKMGGLKK